MRAEVDRIVDDALERHDEPAANAPMLKEVPARSAGSAAASLVVAAPNPQPVPAAAAARRALWAVGPDAARSSRRAGRDPELALGVCVAYAIIAKLPRTVLRCAERARPEPRGHPHSHRAV